MKLIALFILVLIGADLAAPSPAFTGEAIPTELEKVAGDIAKAVVSEASPERVTAYLGALEVPKRCGAEGQNQAFVASYRQAFEQARTWLSAENVEAFYQGVCEAWQDVPGREAAAPEQVVPRLRPDFSESPVADAEPMPIPLKGKKCTFSKTSGSTQISGIAYVRDNGCSERERSDITIITRERKPENKELITTVEMHLITEGTVLYLLGLRHKKGGIMSRENVPIDDTLKAYRGAKCEPWQPDDSVLNVPADIEISYDSSFDNRGKEGHPTFSEQPEGRAKNLIVLVHGCCTDVNSIWEWYDLRNKMAEALSKQGDGREWELVVWEWYKDRQSGEVRTPVPPEGIYKLAFLQYAKIAYTHATVAGRGLAQVIDKNVGYRYIHLIGHSAGAKVINEAALQLAVKKNRRGIERPFVHVTFLDAFTPEGDEYGAMPNNFLPHVFEHYFHNGLLYTDLEMQRVVNYDISEWGSAKACEMRDFGHHWPRYWYERSVREQDGYGFPLSIKIAEGGEEVFHAEGAPACRLKGRESRCYRAPDPGEPRVGPLRSQAQ